MNEPVLHARIELEASGRVLVLAPRIGRWSGHPRAGAFLGPGSPLGWLESLNRRYVLALPDAASGRIVGDLPADRAVAVEFGETLLVLEPIASGDPEPSARTASAPGLPAVGGLSAGQHALLAPTDGVFYRSPRPGAAPFVEAGQRIREGQPVGLVEVMKTFGPVLYGGPGLPEEAEVVEVRADDGTEIRAGQVLVVVR